MVAEDIDARWLEHSSEATWEDTGWIWEGLGVNASWPPSQLSGLGPGLLRCTSPDFSCLPPTHHHTPHGTVLWCLSPPDRLSLPAVTLTWPTKYSTQPPQKTCSSLRLLPWPQSSSSLAGQLSPVMAAPPDCVVRAEMHMSPSHSQAITLPVCSSPVLYCRSLFPSPRYHMHKGRREEASAGAPAFAPPHTQWLWSQLRGWLPAEDKGQLQLFCQRKAQLLSL